MKTVKVSEENHVRLVAKIRKCPFCGYTVFKRTTIDEVYMVDDGKMITDELTEYPLTCEYKYECANCGKDVTDE